MEQSDLITVLKSFVTEADTYHQAGNFEDAAQVLSRMHQYMQNNVPILEPTPIPNPENGQPTNGTD